MFVVVAFDRVAGSQGGSGKEVAVYHVSVVGRCETIMRERQVEQYNTA